MYIHTYKVCQYIETNARKSFYFMRTRIYNESSIELTRIETARLSRLKLLNILIKYYYKCCVVIIKSACMSNVNKAFNVHIR